MAGLWLTALLLPLKVIAEGSEYCPKKALNSFMTSVNWVRELIKERMAVNFLHYLVDINSLCASVLAILNNVRFLSFEWLLYLERQLSLSRMATEHYGIHQRR